MCTVCANIRREKYYHSNQSIRSYPNDTIKKFIMIELAQEGLMMMVDLSFLNYHFSV
jgi:hypothetical protein